MVADDAIAVPAVGPQRLRLAVVVVIDDRVGGIEDRLRAAVVLIEDDRRDVREGVLEVEDVAEVGTPERVDAVVDEHTIGDVGVRRVDFEVVHGTGVATPRHLVDHDG